MKKKPGGTIETYPAIRLLSSDICDIGLKKHHVKALIEFDVTDSREKLKLFRNISGQRISFNAWILKCIGQAVYEHREVHALKKGRNSLVIFDDIDISMTIERRVDGKHVPLPVVIRNVNGKNINQIYTEIENAKKETVSGDKNAVLGKNKMKPFIKLFSLLPKFFRIMIWKIMLADPEFVKENMGTVAVTSVGTVGVVSGWAVPLSIHPLCIALGSVVKKPGVRKGGVEVREYLETTVLIDHDVMDGAPASRFIAKLAGLIENGYGL
jgi:pyruvate/2-oxoglutarate dehydrogenase complex dihydrolipoamide acyltransferase (E2) component